MADAVIIIKPDKVKAAIDVAKAAPDDVDMDRMYEVVNRLRDNQPSSGEKEKDTYLKCEADTKKVYQKYLEDCPAVRLLQTDGAAKAFPICVENNTCDAADGETVDNCPADCKPPPVCDNDDVCDTTDGETIANCPNDCVPDPVCGNRICDPGETKQSCPDDCGKPDDKDKKAPLNEYDHSLRILFGVPVPGRGYRAATPDSAGAAAAGWESVDAGRSDVAVGIRAEYQRRIDLGEGFHLGVGPYFQHDIVTRDNNGETDYSRIDALGVIGGASYAINLGSQWYIEPEFNLQLGIIENSGGLDIGKSGNYTYNRNDFWNKNLNWPSLAFRPGVSFGMGPASLFLALKLEPAFNGMAIGKTNPDSGRSGPDRFSRGNEVEVGYQHRF